MAATTNKTLKLRVILCPFNLVKRIRQEKITAENEGIVTLL
ncbi:hypothetical protein DSOL_0329 [Desulfosporosinus metallidurans]|uniref:Uncharacterized protein n=1 Tax=Desulfosporosinus metallidurans TaxID=1888891 RepID=A0A1Q8R202_9FIRM|nr:hypothetical protein DSOL_0329 [Desulfosporosinus metallidurans]